MESKQFVDVYNVKRINVMSTAIGNVKLNENFDGKNKCFVGFG